MSARTDVLLWAQRVLGKKNATAHQLLEVKTDATFEQVQDAFHTIAKLAHPDLCRHALGPEDLETVTLAYSRVTGAYQELRTQLLPSRRPVPPAPPARVSETTPLPHTPGPDKAVSVGAATQMSSKALVHYRKAELALRRGDLKGALLQLKMAIASDPQSTFLRTALSEVEAELAKNP